MASSPPRFLAPQQSFRGHVKSHLKTSKDIIVIKVGTSSLVRPEQQTLNLSNLARICETVRALHDQGHHVIIVSSGAVGAGCQRMKLQEKPTDVAQRQALAAIGQVHLMRYYEDFFSAMNITCAQVLLTLDSLANRDRYLNARNTFAELLAYGAIPIVNENDTVAVQELRFGDNDTLAAQVAALVQADWLFLMTDVDHLYTANPKDDPTATPIYEVEDISQLAVDISSSGTQWGTGGMSTKLTAGRIATAAGCTMVISNSTHPEGVMKVLAGERVGTKFHPRQTALRGRKRWILSVPVRGTIYLDDVAVRSVKAKKRSLFATGITKVEGDFQRQDAVSLCDSRGHEFGRGLVNFNADELQRLKVHTHASGALFVLQGMTPETFISKLGYNAQAAVVHRGNLALLTTAAADEVAVAEGKEEEEEVAGEEDHSSGVAWHPPCRLPVMRMYNKQEHVPPRACTDGSHMRPLLLHMMHMQAPHGNIRA